METLHYNDNTSRYFPYGIPVTENARNRFDIDAPETGAGAAVPFRFARALASRMNEGHDFSRSDAQSVTAGELLAMMLLNEVFRHLVHVYCRDVSPEAIDGGLAYTKKTRGAATVKSTLPAYVYYYPPTVMRNQPVVAEDFLSTIPNKELTFVEILIVQMAHENPAMQSYRPLFDNGGLRATTPYDAFFAALEEWFATQPAFPDSGLTLLHLLREPFLHNPDSLKGQLDYIMQRWQAWLPPELLERLLITQGALREETMMRGFGPGPVDALSFGSQDYDEPEAFSQDEDWMPRVVLIAKLAYVWLDQLSVKYKRPLTHLNDIPDEELDQMARWGFNALWLIGVWERSPASSEIKQRMGNPEAAASAYSLYDYTIAADLGGEAAYQDLAHRARQRGIRLAGDMVPNHVGLYSRWVVEHPDWFVQLHEPPFPGYTFNGPDLSKEDRISLFIEDGYWNHSDAAVVFKRVDNHTGDVRYIYHGNDGTSMPWNDTAQLDFMLPQVREAVIQAIIHVARMFPIIRFDAAMTLAKRHYQRLWFPRPGEGGAIPSRAEHGIDKAAFDTVFPVEFWREVVDRIAAEAPDTLLLAEAFWLMEGYFVRTLGMHRVYNSAFMNMLKEEDNANYRQTLKNVLEFSPAILQRFVNFMNNPDEDTAQAQFGKGDKYFGVAAMLVTMPGLPMFGHGQIEGFAEKYGMEYRRAYHQEIPDGWLIERHEREIFPLMRKRYLFSGAANFALFDFITPDGWVDESVYAYTNRAFDERALIVYNNAYNTTRGVLHTSTAINVGSAEEQDLKRHTLVDALALDTDPRYYTILSDVRTRLEYLRHTATMAEAGLHFELDAYEYRAFTAIREVCDNDRSWGRLHALLGDKGVPDMEEAYMEMYLSDILNPFRTLMKTEMVDHLLTTDDMEDLPGPWRPQLVRFLTAISAFTDMPRNNEAVLDAIEANVHRLRTFIDSPSVESLPEPVRMYLEAPLPDAEASLEARLAFWRPFAVCCLLRPVGMIAQPDATNEVIEAQSATWMRSWLLVKHIRRAFAETTGDLWRAQQDARLVYACTAQRAKLMALDSDIWSPLLYTLFEDADTRALLQVNIFSNRRWLNKEALENLLHKMFVAVACDFDPKDDAEKGRLVECYVNIQDILNAAADTCYDFDWMLDTLK